jgi:hypothetical protein
LLAASFKLITSKTGGKFVTGNNDINDSKPLAQCWHLFKIPVPWNGRKLEIFLSRWLCPFNTSISDQTE